MGYADTPVALWGQKDVAQWAAAMGLPPAVQASFQEHQVEGADLPLLTAEDLTTSFGCTPFMAKKIQAELSKLGAGPAVGYPAAPPPAGYPPPLSPTASGAPVSPTAAGAPLQGQVSGISQGGSGPLGSQPSSSRERELELESSARQREMDALRVELDRERLKAELRQEMETKARLAAMEAAAANRATAAPPVVVTSNNNMQANMQQQQQQQQMGPSPSARLVRTERHCGCCSFLLFFIFPCICFCPIDKRNVVYEQAYVKVGTTSKKGAMAAGAAYGVAAGLDAFS